MYKIVKAECLADKIYLMDVEAPRVARACQPGEFVIVKMDEAGERIPLTICDFDREKSLKVFLTFICVVYLSLVFRGTSLNMPPRGRWTAHCCICCRGVRRHIHP